MAVPVTAASITGEFLTATKWREVVVCVCVCVWTLCPHMAWRRAMTCAYRAGSVWNTMSTAKKHQ